MDPDKDKEEIIKQWIEFYGMLGYPLPKDFDYRPIVEMQNPKSENIDGGIPFGKVAPLKSPEVNISEGYSPIDKSKSYWKIPTKTSAPKESNKFDELDILDEATQLAGVLPWYEGAK
jgi:hypothetical protein